MEELVKLVEDFVLNTGKVEVLGNLLQWGVQMCDYFPKDLKLKNLKKTREYLDKSPFREFKEADASEFLKLIVRCTFKYKDDSNYIQRLNEIRSKMNFY